MNGLDVADVKYLVVEPALTALGLMSTAALNQVTGTSLAESNLARLQQAAGGPARSPWQIQQATEADIWANYLEYNPEMAVRVRSLLAAGPSWPQVTWNLAYAAALCRLIYYRVRAPLPEPRDASGMAMCWHVNYNTDLGKGEADPEHTALFAAAIMA